MTAIDTAAKIRKVGQSARTAFVQRVEAVRAIELALVANEHAILLGPPGTGKSSLIRFFADGLGLGCFRKLLNPDIKREDLVGPIDPSSINTGKWTRSWLGLATEPIIFLDEIGKASGQVQNMVLDAMEERLVSSGSDEFEIPMVSLFSASNETIDSNPALWDRFAIRCVVGYIQGSDQFVSFLTSRKQMPVRVSVTPTELKECRLECKRMAQNPSDEVLAVMVELWSGIKTIISSRISDRRWERVLIIAAANALLEGRTEIRPSDLSVATTVIWSSLNEIKPITDFVTDTVNKEELALRTMTGLIETLESEAAAASKRDDLAEKAKTSYKAQKLIREINTHAGDVWTALMVRAENVNSAMIA